MTNIGMSLSLDSYLTLEIDRLLNIYIFSEYKTIYLTQ